MSTGKRDVIVAIDFGTTYSGFAFSPVNAIEESDICVFRGWGRGQGFSFFKTPTCVLLTPEGDFYKFGHAAVETYAKHLARNEGKDLLFFDRFKFVLYNSKVSAVFVYLFEINIYLYTGINVNEVQCYS